MEYSRFANFLELEGWYHADRMGDEVPDDYMVILYTEEDDIVEIDFRKHFRRLGISYSEVKEQARQLNSNGGENFDPVKCAIWGR